MNNIRLFNILTVLLSSSLSALGIGVYDNTKLLVFPADSGDLRVVHQAEAAFMSPDSNYESAKLDDQRFRKTFWSAYRTHHGELNGHEELLDHLTAEIACLLDIDQADIIIAQPEIKKVYDNQYIEESISVDKNGQVINAAFDAKLVDPSIESARLNACVDKHLGKRSIKIKCYPPYMQKIDKPSEKHYQTIFEDLGHGNKTWPHYQYCSYAKCQKFLASPNICSRCKQAFYCGAQCQKQDWLADHKAWCNKKS